MLWRHDGGTSMMSAFGAEQFCPLPFFRGGDISGVLSTTTAAYVPLIWRGGKASRVNQ